MANLVYWLTDNGTGIGYGWNIRINLKKKFKKLTLKSTILVRLNVDDLMKTDLKFKNYLNFFFFFWLKLLNKYSPIRNLPAMGQYTKQHWINRWMVISHFIKESF